MQVVAVLLENFTRAVHLEKSKILVEQEQSQMKAMGVSRADLINNPLDPLLNTLSRFRSEDDLMRRIRLLFKVLDSDTSGTVDFQELHEGLRKMVHLEPQIHLSNDDYTRLTRDGTLCNMGGMAIDAFDFVLRTEVENYVTNRVATAYDQAARVDADSDVSALL
eukprot:CAMPEP_0113726102 /NCGR_PEP_ID=MMETSP0038_2-20120614/40205_1 /TAXON_ID=2898 /ORGANISM="Cryptomonas paramecium" /LENGTH=163 /DNA_ID=CAMNT_0000656591 /DNA_START=156 /DNA_END=644 /DNA_ORIENTATION=- /assembly_acc=CAM_ASM_000170